MTRNETKIEIISRFVPGPRTGEMFELNDLCGLKNQGWREAPDRRWGEPKIGTK